MIIVQLIRSPDAQVETHRVSDLLAFLKAELGAHFPPGSRITDGASGRDVTPRTPEDIAALRGMAGPFVVEVAPGEVGFWTALAVAVASSTASMILASIFAQEPPNSTARNVQQESPNNGLSERTNKVRVNGRVPDIYGQVRSTPDLLAPPYKIFENHVEKEVAYMCIGRGAYEIHDARDDTTQVTEIAGASVEVYAPFTSPNSGSAPQLRIGNAINLPVITAKRVNSVNGQVLQPQDVGSVVRRGMVFRSPNEIVSQDPNVDFADLFIPGDSISVQFATQTDGIFTYTPALGATFVTEPVLSPTWGEINFAGNHSGDWSPTQLMTLSNATVYWPGDGETGSAFSTNVGGNYEILSSSYNAIEDETTIRVDIQGNTSAWGVSLSGGSGGTGTGTPTFSRTSGVVLFDLSGTYLVTTVTSGLLTLNNPSAVNADWNVLEDDYGGISAVLNPTITTTGERWVGWFTVESIRPISRIISNVVALNGLYKDNGRQQYRRDVTYRIEAQRVDGAGVPFGAVSAFERTISGSAVSRSTRADTLDAMLPGAGSTSWRFRARRLTDSDTEFEGSVVDEIKWRDLYACSAVDQAHFGDVTTVQSVNFATDGALAIKERKLNLLVTRKLPQRIAGSSFTSELYPTRSVADILSAVCVDPQIGNRPASEIDFDNFYQTQQDIIGYFGVDIAQFNYTIDSDNLSFEETISMIAEAVYCRAYRRGSVIRLFFERKTDDSSILFSHRNKLPGSEQRTEGSAAENDGVEYQWINPANDAAETIYLPTDRSAVNPKRIESVGVRIAAQASIHAYREWNKLRFQDLVTKFDALPEANLLTISERILCADNTRGQSQDGDIISVDTENPRLVTLSQAFDWSGGASFTIFLQNRDAVVEAMGVSSGGSSRIALLERAPRTPLVVRGDGYNATAYIITSNMNARQAQPFLLTEKEVPNDDGTIPLTAINYDPRYYQNDFDFA